jgi:hypothetical protein
MKRRQKQRSPMFPVLQNAADRAVLMLTTDITITGLPEVKGGGMLYIFLLLFLQ